MVKSYPSSSSLWLILGVAILFSTPSCRATEPHETNPTYRRYLRRHLVTASEVLQEGQGYNPNVDNQSYTPPPPPPPQSEYEQRTQQGNTNMQAALESHAINRSGNGVGGGGSGGGM